MYRVRFYVELGNVVTNFAELPNMERAEEYLMWVSSLPEFLGGEIEEHIENIGWVVVEFQE